MGGLEIAFLAVGLAGVAVFTSVSLHFSKRRTARRALVEVPVPELEAALQPADAPLKVRVLADTGPSGAATRIVVEGVCGRLTLHKERPLPPPPPPRPESWLDEGAPPPPLPAPELEIGDPVFDPEFFVLGPPPLVYAILDAETRRQLLQLALQRLPGEVAVGHGELRVELPFSCRLHRQAVEDRGAAAVAVARRLLEPGDVAGRLAENIKNDPVAAVRLRNLSAAVRTHGDNPVTRDALRAAASDRDLEVRLRAGLALGPEGRDTLLSVVESPTADDAAMETAMDALGADVPGALLTSVLRRSLGAQLTDTPRYPRAARACLAALERARPRDAVSRLQAVLLSNASLAEDAARALGKIGGGEAEAALMGALDGDVFESRLAAAAALGDAGTTAAVAPLREAERHGVVIRRIARQAIARIQARATSAPGAISLAGGEAGQVTMAEDETGRVSLPAVGRIRERS